MLWLYYNDYNKFRDIYDPFYRRVWNNDDKIVVADTHTLDIKVIYEGKEIRPYLIAFEDMRTRRIIWTLTPFAPNSLMIINTLKKVFKEIGKPEIIIFDNGKDYMSKALMYIIKHYNIRLHTAIPYNAREKPIERFFYTFIMQFAKLQAGYTGDIHHKINKASKRAVKAKMKWNDLLLNLTDYMNKYNADKIIENNEVIEDMDYIFGLRKELKVRSNGVTLQRDGVKRDYWAEELFEYIGEKVIVTITDNLEYLHITDLDNNYICLAEYQGVGDFKTKANMDQYITRKRKMRREIKKLKEIYSEIKEEIKEKKIIDDNINEIISTDIFPDKYVQYNGFHNEEEEFDWDILGRVADSLQDDEYDL